MRNLFPLRLLAISLLVFAVGCHDSTAPKIVASGHWNGQGTTSGVFNLDMTLTESSGVVTGAGSLSSATAIALTISGSYTGQSITLTLSSPGYSPINFSGTVASTTMTGTLNGSGFINSALTLNRI